MGVILLAASMAAFVKALPRDGKTAKFVGSQWEGYVVVGLICVFGLGLMLAVTGAIQLIKGRQAGALHDKGQVCTRRRDRAAASRLARARRRHGSTPAPPPAWP